MHSGVVKIKSFQLERQQVGKVQKSQTLCGDAFTQKSVKKGRSRKSLIFMNHDSQETFTIHLLCGHRISFGSAHRSTGWVRPEFLVG